MELSTHGGERAPVQLQKELSLSILEESVGALLVEEELQIICVCHLTLTMLSPVDLESRDTTTSMEQNTRNKLEAAQTLMFPVLFAM